VNVENAIVCVINKLRDKFLLVGINSKTIKIMADEVKATETVEEVGFVNGIVQEIINSPLNLALIAIITFLIFKIFKSRQPPKPSPPAEPELPKLRKDFTVAELKAYDGNQPDGRVLVAVNGNVYDVTRGKRFYGPGESICCDGAAPTLSYF
jgi:Cytochrome b5-like Heme/Steroid binding domain